METIIKENTRYTIVILDKYILCDIKDYIASDIMFAPIDNLGKHKIKSYLSEKILMNEAFHHVVQWFINLDRMKEWYEAKAKAWWDDITILDSALKEAGFVEGIGTFGYLFMRGEAIKYCIDNKLIKIVKVKEKIVLEL